MDEATFLAEVPLFSAMNEAQLQRIARFARRLICRAGDVIIREGERDGRLFIILTGEVEVVKGAGRKHEKRLAVFGPCGYFGEMALIDELARSASVIAKTDSELLSIDQRDFRRELKESPTMALELLRLLSHRVRALEMAIAKTLGGLIPICAGCKKIRDEHGLWTPLETYIEDNTEAYLTHGICPDCARKYYPKLFPDNPEQCDT